MTPDQIRQSFLYSLIKGFREPPKRIPGPWLRLTDRCCAPFLIFFGFIVLLFYIGTLIVPELDIWGNAFFVMSFIITFIAFTGCVICLIIEFFFKDKYFVPNPAYEAWPAAPPEIKPVPWLTAIATVFALICGILELRSCSHSFLKSSVVETITGILSGCLAWIFWTAAKVFGKPKPQDDDDD